MNGNVESALSTANDTPLNWGLGEPCAGFAMQRIDLAMLGLDFTKHARRYCEQVTGKSLRGIAIEDYHRHIPVAMQLPNEVNLNSCTHRADAESDPDLYCDYARLLLHLSENVIGEDLVFESRPAMRLHFPQPSPDNYRLPNGQMACFHNDIMFGEPAEQINCWLSISNCKGSAGLQIANLADSCSILRRFVSAYGLTRRRFEESRPQFFEWMREDPEVHQFVASKMHPLLTTANEIALFDPVTIHGTAENIEDATRASIDFRVLRLSDFDRIVKEAALKDEPLFGFDDMKLERGDYYQGLTIREYAKTHGLSSCGTVGLRLAEQTA